MMMKGRNNGKKLLTLRIVAHAFEIIHLLTDQNPIQVGLDELMSIYRTQFLLSRFSLMLLLTLAPVKTPPVSVRKELSVVRPLMFRLSDG